METSNLSFPSRIMKEKRDVFSSTMMLIVAKKMELLVAVVSTQKSRKQWLQGCERFVAAEGRSGVDLSSVHGACASSRGSMSDKGS